MFISLYCKQSIFHIHLHHTFTISAPSLHTLGHADLHCKDLWTLSRIFLHPHRCNWTIPLSFCLSSLTRFLTCWWGTPCTTSLSVLAVSFLLKVQSVFCCPLDVLKSTLILTFVPICALNSDLHRPRMRTYLSHTNDSFRVPPNTSILPNSLVYAETSHIPARYVSSDYVLSDIDFRVVRASPPCLCFGTNMLYHIRLLLLKHILLDPSPVYLNIMVMLSRPFIGS